MARLEKPGRGNASLSRRALIAAAPVGLLAACQPAMRTTVSTTPKLDLEGLNRAIAGLARRAAPAALGVGLMNLESGETFTFNGQRPFPMQSVFKLLLGAAVLAEADQGRMALGERFVLTDEQLSPPFSPIAEAWPGRRDYTARELLAQAVSVSDNTAADVLMRRIGGPGAVSAWLASHRVPEIRVDRYERELQPEVYGMASFRPEWRTPAGFARARAAVDPARRMQAMRAYLADPRDTATPRAMLELLQLLDRGDLVSPASTRLLLELMIRTPSGPGRLKAGLPKDAVLAHKTGTSGTDQGLTPAVNDVGIFTLADKRSYAISAFLAGSTLDEAGREGLIADVARAAVDAVG